MQFAKRVVFALFLSLSLGACTPSSDNKGPAVSAGSGKVSSLSAAAAACEKKIRQQMEDKTLFLQASSALQNFVDQANTELGRTNESRYQIGQAKEQNVSFQVDHSISSGNASERLSYEIGLNNHEVGAPFYFRITFETTRPGINTQLKQAFVISEACELSLTTTSLDTIKKESNDYFFSEATYYFDGRSDHTSNRFNVPEGAPLANFSVLNDFNLLDNSYYLYMPGVGLLSLKLGPTLRKSLNAFGAGFDLIGKKLILF